MTAIGSLREPAARVEPVAFTDPYTRATVLIAGLAVVATGLDLQLRGLSVTLAIALVLLPLTVRSLRAYTLAPLIATLTVVAVASGLALSRISAIDHGMSLRGQVDALSLLLSGMGAMLLLLWARQLLPLPTVVALFGAGALLDSFMTGNMSWKYGLSVPTTLLVLGLVERQGRRGLATGIIIAFGLFGVLDEGRSYFGMCLLAATLTLWQMRPRGSDGPGNRWFPAMLLLGLGAGIYYLASALLTGGYLGETVQERSITQIETSGSLLAGGRPEWAGRRELMRLQPAGYGVGVAPNWNDVQAGKSALLQINAEAGGYADNYMFNGQFRLHSVTADLWASYGWAGLLLAFTIIFALVRSISWSVAERTALTSVTFFSTLAIWFMIFGPIFSNWLEVCAALGLALIAKPSDVDARSLPAEPAEP